MLDLTFFKELLNRIGVMPALGFAVIFAMWGMVEQGWLVGWKGMIGMVVTVGIVAFYRSKDTKLTEEEPECECEGGETQ